MKKYLSLLFTLIIIGILVSCEPYVEKKELANVVQTTEATREPETTKEVDETKATEETKINVTEEVYDNPIIGDRFQQNVTGNAKGGYQWKWISTKNCMQYDDEMINFADPESTTEIGDTFYFLKGAQAGDDVLIFELYDTTDDKVYCEIDYDLSVDTKLNITLKKKTVKDNRGDKLKAYTFDEPRVYVQGDEH